jgi:hypothetical protein
VSAQSPPPRPARYFLMAPGVYLPMAACALLEERLGVELRRLRIAVRGSDPQIDEALHALRLAGLIHRDSVTGSVHPRKENQ